MYFCALYIKGTFFHHPLSHPGTGLHLPGGDGDPGQVGPLPVSPLPAVWITVSAALLSGPSLSPGRRASGDLSPETVIWVVFPRGPVPNSCPSPPVLAHAEPLFPCLTHPRARCQAAGGGLHPAVTGVAHTRPSVPASAPSDRRTGPGLRFPPLPDPH